MPCLCSFLRFLQSVPLSLGCQERDQNMFVHKDIRISRHAIMRAKERFGLGVMEIAQKAYSSLTDGVDALGCPILRPMCIYAAKKKKASGIYLFEGILFVFKDDVVVTVMPCQWAALSSTAFS